MATTLEENEIIGINGQRESTRRFFIRNFIYHLQSDRRKATYYCAARKHPIFKCGVKIVKEKQWKIIGIHTEKGQPHYLEEMKIIKELEKLAISSFEEPQNVFDEISEKYEESEAMINISYVRAEKIIIRAREIVPVPKTFKELANGIRNHSKLKKLFRAHVVVTEEEQEAIILIHKNMIDELNRAAVLQVDGVFKVIPTKPNLTQLWILHTSKEGDLETLPAVFVITKGAKEMLYRSILEQLIIIAPKLKDQSITLISDFEQAVINAVQKELPNAKIVGCWFHFCQAITKYWDKLSLQHAPKEALYLSQKVALAPFQYFQTGLMMIEKVIEDNRNQWPNMTIFLNYLHRQWSNKKMIVFNFGSQIRTNNTAEAFNRHLVQRFGGKNPGFFKFLHKLNVIITSESLNVKRIERGIPIHKEKKSVEKHAKHMKILIAQKKMDENGDIESFVYEVMDDAVQDLIMIERQKREDKIAAGLFDVIDSEEIEAQKSKRDNLSECEDTEYGVDMKTKKKTKRVKRVGERED